MEIVGYPLFSLANIADRVVNRRFPAPGKIHANIKIFVFQHFETKLPECFDDRSIYVPIHAGSTMSDIDIPDALRDDTMPSISEFNIYLNEMTAIYWVGKHIAEIGNPDYIGFAHYRRCLDWTPRLLKPGIVFASRFVSCATNRRFFTDCHSSEWLDLFLSRFRELSDEYGDVEAFWRTHSMYIANNFITDRDTFLRYFAFVEQCLEICIDILKDNKQAFQAMSASGRRQFSFIMERMTAYWIWHEKKNRRINVVSSRLKCYDIDNNLTSVR